MSRLLLFSITVALFLFQLSCESPAAKEDPVIPTVNLEEDSRMVTRNTTAFTVTAFLDSPTTVPVTVPFSITGTAAAGQHYTCADNAFTFAPGDTVQTLTFNVVNNGVTTGFYDVVVKLDSSMQASRGEQAVDSVVIASNPVDTFQVTGDALPGWQQSPYKSDLFVAVGEGLYEVINGGATPYIECNYQAALWQVLENATGQSITILAMEYPQASDADSIFIRKTSPAEGDVDEFTSQLPGYELENVKGTEIIGGMRYVMRFGKIYFEVSLNEFSDSGSAVTAAQSITAFLTAKL